jgi:hypothetical protein
MLGETKAWLYCPYLTHLCLIARLIIVGVDRQRTKKHLTKYGGGNPSRKEMLLWVATATQSIQPTPSRRGPQCFQAVPQRRGWWNIKATNYKTQLTTKTISRTASFIRNKEHNSTYQPIIAGETPTVTTRTNNLITYGTRTNDAVRPASQSPHATRQESKGWDSAPKPCLLPHTNRSQH